MALQKVGMVTFVRVCFGLAAVLLVVSVATCYVGVQHEIHKIPPQERAGMGDTDWIGAKWVYRSMLLAAAASALCLTSGTVLLLKRLRGQRGDES